MQPETLLVFLENFENSNKKLYWPFWKISKISITTLPLRSEGINYVEYQIL